jgi:hypothetical protein
MPDFVRQFQEMMARHSGRADGRQVRLRCPFCQCNALDVGLGGTGKLIAHCLSPGCADRKGNHLLRQLGLPVEPLADADREALLTSVLTRPTEACPSVPRAPAGLRHQVYSDWLDACSPDDRARAFLAGYGLSDEEVTRRGYGCWPTEGVLSRFTVTDPERLKTVPGVIADGGGKLDTTLHDPRYAGVLVPVRDAEGRVVALKVRLYEPDDAGKMRSFSSSHRGGPEAEYAIHHPLGSKQSSRVYMVEGEIKADVVAALAGVTVLGLPGVHGI